MNHLFIIYTVFLFTLFICFYLRNVEWNQMLFCEDPFSWNCNITLCVDSLRLFAKWLISSCFWVNSQSYSSSVPLGKVEKFYFPLLGLFRLTSCDSAYLLYYTVYFTPQPVSVLSVYVCWVFTGNIHHNFTSVSHTKNKMNQPSPLSLLSPIWKQEWGVPRNTQVKMIEDEVGCCGLISLEVKQSQFIWNPLLTVTVHTAADGTGKDPQCTIRYKWTH